MPQMPRPDGVAIATQVWPGRRRDVVFAHGLGQTRAAWSASVDIVAARGFRCVAYDARGHGGSGWNGTAPHAFDQMVDDVVAVAATGRSRPVLVGASMGGLAGLVAEARYAPLFGALVLVDVTPRWEARGVERILDFMRAHPDGFASLQEAADAIAAHLPGRRERKSPDRLRSLLVAREDGRLRWHWDPRLLDELAGAAESWQPTFIDAAKRIGIPTLLISGSVSELVSRANVEEFLHLVPHARHVLIPDASHLVVGDTNTAFTRTLIHFIESLDSEES